ncbi:zf-HC2 domain-containing protein [Agromyces sp. SYSU K20354]|uniref:anti-sigma factor family protein n=1 Tax=Agromyces cavernae TaxID=2898659 RepID=UPI001E554287|nr:zf-HC2 domain-containing protein [Agromyces cavernae]MCD2442689.1 zf-HC2 domain-containing protein [Agromyces cavernae]
MNPNHARFAEWDSAYVLGALSPTDRREFEEHLETCELCMRAVAELASMPGLLARLAPDRARALAQDPDGASAPVPRDDLLEAVRRADRRRRARRTRYWWGAVAAAAAVAVLAIVLPLNLGQPATARESVAFEAAVDIPLTATATLTQVGWGTRIELDCRYGDGDGDIDVPAGGWPYSLVVIERDGTRSEVSSWRARPGAGARLSAASAADLDDIASLEIRAMASGEVLMRGVSGEPPPR